MNKLTFHVAILIFAVASAEARAQEEDASEVIRHVVIEPATAQTPRSDTASIAELSDGRLMAVYHRYERGKHSGHDHGICRIWSKVSHDGGLTWEHPRMLVDVAEGDMNVQAPALLRLTSGPLLLICLRAHEGGGSSTMCLFSSDDEGRSFSALDPIWKRSNGQLLQGGASSLVELTSGRLLLPFHGGSGNQWRQKNSAWCFVSDDRGKTWKIIGNIADDPDAEYTNLDCLFTSKGDAILTYMYAKPAWNRNQIHLKAALIPRKWFRIGT